MRIDFEKLEKLMYEQKLNYNKLEGVLNSEKFRSLYDNVYYKRNFCDSDIEKICKILNVEFKNCGQILDLTRQNKIEYFYKCENLFCDSEEKFELPNKYVVVLKKIQVVDGEKPINLLLFLNQGYFENETLQVIYGAEISSSLKFKNFNEANAFIKLINTFSEKNSTVNFKSKLAKKNKNIFELNEPTKNDSFEISELNNLRKLRIQ